MNTKKNSYTFECFIEYTDNTTSTIRYEEMKPLYSEGVILLLCGNDEHCLVLKNIKSIHCTPV